MSTLMDSSLICFLSLEPLINLYVYKHLIGRLIYLGVTKRGELCKLYGPVHGSLRKTCSRLSISTCLGPTCITHSPHRSSAGRAGWPA